MLPNPSIILVKHREKDCYVLYFDLEDDKKFLSLRSDLSGLKEIDIYEEDDEQIGIRITNKQAMILLETLLNFEVIPRIGNVSGHVIAEIFRSMCEKSINPDLYATLVEEIIPALKLVLSNFNNPKEKIIV